MIFTKRFASRNFDCLSPIVLMGEQAFAARRVGSVPSNVTVHYVSQEVVLSDEQRDKASAASLIQPSFNPRPERATSSTARG